MEKTFDIGLGVEVWVIHRNHIVKGTVSKVWYTKFISPVDYESVGNRSGTSSVMLTVKGSIPSGRRICI